MGDIPIRLRKGCIDALVEIPMDHGEYELTRDDLLSYAEWIRYFHESGLLDDERISHWSQIPGSDQKLDEDG